LTSGIPRRRAAGGDDEVARQRDLQAARDREALDRGDERLVGRALGEASEAAALDVGALAADERLEVHAGREVAAGAGEDPHLELGLAVELLQAGRDALGEREVDGVASVGPVQRDDEDAVAALGEDGRLVVHRAREAIGKNARAAGVWIGAISPVQGVPP
jgi:hypothetical protein